MHKQETIRQVACNTEQCDVLATIHQGHTKSEPSILAHNGKNLFREKTIGIGTASEPRAQKIYQPKP